ncbi:MAG: hypothetical protein HY098_01910 [Nitrospinae bacterium]|nr:hypothetical protein [Nitrospinota bacterium]
MGAKAGHAGKIAALCAVAIFSAPLLAFGMDVAGRVSESVFYQTDDATNQNYNFFNTRLKLDATDVNGVDNSFHFDGSNLGQGEKTYNVQVPANRVDALNLRLERLFFNTDVVLGRQLIDGLVGAKVDGALLEHHFGESSGYGVFGGTLPDPYTDAFASSYPAYGAYGFYKDREIGVTAGYTTSMYNGKEDQAYIFGSAYYSPNDSLNLNGSGRFDHNLQGGNGYYVTNLLVSANYHWGWLAYLNLTYDQYRAVWYQESMTMLYGLNLDLQQTMRVYGDYSLSKTAKIYADYDYRQRESDGGVAFLSTVGFKDSDLFGYLYYNAAYRNIDYFTALSTQMFLAVGAQANERVSGELSATYSANSQNSATNGMTQMIYSASANWLASKKLAFNCVVEASDQKFLSVDSVYLAKYKDEYLTTSVYANLSYRF